MHKKAICVKELATLKSQMPEFQFGISVFAVSERFSGEFKNFRLSISFCDS